MPIKIVIADDHELFRDGFHHMSEKMPELNLIGEAQDGEELILYAVACIQMSLLQILRCLVWMV